MPYRYKRRYRRRRFYGRRRNFRVYRRYYPSRRTYQTLAAKVIPFRKKTARRTNRKRSNTQRKVINWLDQPTVKRRLNEAADLAGLRDAIQNLKKDPLNALELIR